MTFDEFVKKYNGRATDYDGGCGVQCVDLAKLYMDKVCGVKIGAIGNAEAYWRRYNELAILNKNFDRIANTSTFIPQKGDIVVWDKRHGKWGHIAIADGVGTTSYFYSYDQNWGGKGQGMTRIKHTYKSGFAGVLRQKSKQPSPIHKSDFKEGQKVVVYMLIAVCHDNGGDKLFVENLNQDINGRKQFWIHRNCVENNYIHALGTICYVEGEHCLVQVLDEQFWCKKENLYIDESLVPKTKQQNIKSTVGQKKKLKTPTKIYSNSNLTGIEYNYKTNTTVQILANVTSEIDKVHVIATGREGFISTSSYK